MRAQGLVMPHRAIAALSVGQIGIQQPLFAPPTPAAAPTATSLAAAATVPAQRMQLISSCGTNAVAAGLPIHTPTPTHQAAAAAEKWCDALLNQGLTCPVYRIPAAGCCRRSGTGQVLRRWCASMGCSRASPSGCGAKSSSCPSCGTCWPCPTSSI